ncbi:MAG: hypothetical protein DRI61_15085, partial [Chloroflexi bacterium]
MPGWKVNLIAFAVSPKRKRMMLRKWKRQGKRLSWRRWKELASDTTWLASMRLKYGDEPGLFYLAQF